MGYVNAQSRLESRYCHGKTDWSSKKQREKKCAKVCEIHGSKSCIKSWLPCTPFINAVNSEIVVWLLEKEKHAIFYRKVIALSNYFQLRLFFHIAYRSLHLLFLYIFHFFPSSVPLVRGFSYSSNSKELLSPAFLSFSTTTVNYTPLNWHWKQ